MSRRCPICSADDWSPRVGALRDAPDIGVVQCVRCGVVIPEREPAVAIDYASGSMFGAAVPNFDALRQGGATDNKRRVAALREVVDQRPLIDLGCGAGGFLSLVGSGTPKFGVELDQESRQYCLDEGLKVYRTLDEIPEHTREEIQVLTLFHVLEHSSDPRGFLEQALAQLPAVDVVVIEVPCSEDPLLNVVFSEPFAHYTYWSHHCHLHSLASLRLTLGSVLSEVHVERVQRYGLANHLGWLTQGGPGGDTRFAWASGTEVDLRYRESLIDLGYSDTLWATARPLRG